MKRDAYNYGVGTYHINTKKNLMILFQFKLCRLF